MILAGVTKDQVKASIVNEILKVEATRNNSVPKDWQPLGRYQEEISCQLKLDVWPEFAPEKSSAVQRHGILILRLPLRETTKPEVIQVR